MAFRFNEDTSKYFADNINSIKHGVVDVDRLVDITKTSLEEGAYQDAQLSVGRARMKIVTILQCFDKLSVTISNEARNETFSGYRPLVIGNDDKEVSKSDSPVNLIRNILRGEIRNGQSIAKVLGTRAKNE
jgi:hypothetical protein